MESTGTPPSPIKVPSPTTNFTITSSGGKASLSPFKRKHSKIQLLKIVFELEFNMRLQRMF